MKISRKKRMNAITLISKDHKLVKLSKDKAELETADLCVDINTISAIASQERLIEKEIKKITQEAYNAYLIQQILEKKKNKKKNKKNKKKAPPQEPINEVYNQPYNFDVHDPISGMITEIKKENDANPIELNLTEIMMENNIKHFLGEDCFIDEESNAHARAVFMMMWNKLCRQYDLGKRGHIVCIGEKIKKIIEIWNQTEFSNEIKRKIIFSHLEMLREIEKIETNDIFHFMFIFDSECEKMMER